MTKADENEIEGEVQDVERDPITVTITDIELESLRREVDEYKEKYVRQLAEIENTRKRLMKERDDMIKHASRNVIAEFLGPIDQMESALVFASGMSEEVKHWAVGFDMILNHFKEVLSHHGVHPMEAEGKIYDPHFHHVSETVETDEHPPGTIIRQTQKGYLCGDQVIRPANVIIAKEKKLEKSRPETDEEESKETNHE